MVLSIAASSAPVAAQTSGPGGGGAGGFTGPFAPNQSGPARGNPGETESAPENLEAPPKERPRSAKLFDSKRVTQSFQVELGPLYYRIAGSRPGPKDFERGTGELRLGLVMTTTWKPFFLAGLQETILRVFD